MNQAAYFIRKTILSSKYGVFYLSTMDICPKTYHFRIILGQIFIAKAPKWYNISMFWGNKEFEIMNSNQSLTIIGRNEEKEILRECMESNKPEFIVVYGRRRVGKTYLIKEFYDKKFSFYSTGVNSKIKKDKLRAFSESLVAYGCHLDRELKDWFDAFSSLKSLLGSPDCYRDPETGKRIVFLDELPWMDSKGSDFKAAFDYFWNTYGSSENDLLLIVCGSATSWIINNILKDTGGFYNRITNQIHLMPFNLKECKELAKSRNLDFDDKTIAKAYMVFGGIGYYWNLLMPSKSLDQEIERLCFDERGALHYEFANLFRSLFSSNGNHRKIIETLSKKSSGLTRNDLIDAKLSTGGKNLTKSLEELEQCGFIRRFNKPNKSNSCFYQIIDPFCRFAIYFLENKKISSWLSYIDSPSYYAWEGISFELLCLNHIKEIKNALGISGIETAEYSFRSKNHVPGAQIDLVIERKDMVVNLCEIKYSTVPYTIDAKYAENLENKKAAFIEETKTKNTVRLTMISPLGIKKNEYSSLIRNVVTLDDFFK